MLTHIKRISKNTFGFSVGTILTSAIGFILIPIYTRYLTPEDYGIISLVTVIGSILSIFFYMGLNGSLGRFYFDYNNDQYELNRYISTIIYFILIFSLFWTIILSFFGELIFKSILENVPFNPYIILIIWTTFFSTLFSMALIMYQMREKSWLYSYLNIIKFLISVSLILFFVVVLKEGALGSIKAGLITSFIFFVVGYHLLKKDMVFKIDCQKLIDSLRFGLPLIPHALAGWILSLIDRIFLNHYQSLAVVGIYSLGYQFGLILNLITTSINMAWSPFMMLTAKEQGDDAKNIFSRLTTYYMVVILFIGLAISLFSKDIIILITTPKFYDSYKIIPIIVGTYVLNGMYYMVVNQIFYSKNTKYLPLATFGSAILNIMFNYLWVPKYGMIGAAWATFVSFVFAFLFTWAISQKVYPIKYEYLRIFKVFVISGVVYALSIIFTYDNLYYDIVSKSSILLLYFVGIFLIGFFTKSELKLISNIISKKDKLKLN